MHPRSNFLHLVAREAARRTRWRRELYALVAVIAFVVAVVALVIATAGLLRWVNAACVVARDGVAPTEARAAGAWATAASTAGESPQGLDRDPREARAPTGQRDRADIEQLADPSASQQRRTEGGMDRHQSFELSEPAAAGPGASRRVVPGLELAGRVVDPRGNPIPGGHVSAHRASELAGLIQPRGTPGERPVHRVGQLPWKELAGVTSTSGLEPNQPRPHGEAQIDSQGHFALSGQPADEDLVLIFSRDPFLQGGMQQGMALRARPPQDPERRDWTLRDPVTVTGRVWSALERWSGDGARVFALDEQVGLWRSVELRGLGAFRLEGLYAGRWVVGASAAGASAWHRVKIGTTSPPPIELQLPACVPEDDSDRAPLEIKVTLPEGLSARGARFALETGVDSMGGAVLVTTIESETIRLRIPGGIYEFEITQTCAPGWETGSLQHFLRKEDLPVTLGVAPRTAEEVALITCGIHLPAGEDGLPLILTDGTGHEAGLRCGLGGGLSGGTH